MSFVIKVLLRILKRNEFESLRLREIFQKKYGIAVGLYSYGCFDVRRIPKGTIIGRYCSFAGSAVIFNGNHGIDYLTTHPYLYNVSLGMVSFEKIQRVPCTIGDDVWMGHNSIVLPSVRFIGRGAVIAAGAVVTKDVPPYSIVAGNPARVIKYRFSQDIIECIEKTKWWEWDATKLKKKIDEDPDFVYRPGFYLKSVTASHGLSV